MTAFFFAIGLEVKHELTVGALAHPRAAVVPALAAVGGVVVPAGVFLAITWGGPAASGWGIPMATDPAFAVGVLALLSRRAPARLRPLLLAIATVDDVLAVVVIAAGYTGGVEWAWLAAAVVGCVLIVLVWGCWVRKLSGAAITGVLAGQERVESQGDTGCGMPTKIGPQAVDLRKCVGLAADSSVLTDTPRWQPAHRPRRSNPAPR